MDKIGIKIKELRNDNGLSQEQFAEHIGISRSNISKWESNKIVPSLEMLTIIANKFDKNINFFVSSDIVLNKGDSEVGVIKKEVKIYNNVKASGFQLEDNEVSKNISHKINNNLETKTKIKAMKIRWYIALFIGILMLLISIIIIVVEMKLSNGISDIEAMVKISISSIFNVLSIPLIIFSILKIKRW